MINIEKYQANAMLDGSMLSVAVKWALFTRREYMENISERCFSYSKLLLGLILQIVLLVFYHTAKNLRKQKVNIILRFKKGKRKQSKRKKKEINIKFWKCSVFYMLIFTNFFFYLVLISWILISWIVDQAISIANVQLICLKCVELLIDKSFGNYLRKEKFRIKFFLSHI